MLKVGGLVMVFSLTGTPSAEPRRAAKTA